MFVKLTNPAIVCIALCHDNPAVMPGQRSMTGRIGIIISSHNPDKYRFMDCCVDHILMKDAPARGT